MFETNILTANKVDHIFEKLGISRDQFKELVIKINQFNFSLDPELQTVMYVNIEKICTLLNVSQDEMDEFLGSLGDAPEGVKLNFHTTQFTWAGTAFLLLNLPSAEIEE